MNQKLYIINQHYYPELASTAQVFQEIAEYFASAGYDVTVIAGLPFYHDNITAADCGISELNGVKIKRLWNTTFKKSSFLGKGLNLLTFQISLLFYALFRIGRSSVVMAGTNPPMAIVSAALAKTVGRFKLVSVVQDLYPDILISSGYSDGSSLSYRLLTRVMKWSFHRCNSVVTISGDMKAQLESIYGVKKVRVINNMVIGDIFPMDNNELKKDAGLDGKLVVMYSGNFGVAHEYNTLLNTVKLLRDNTEIAFRVIGDGIHYNALKAACTEEGLNNIAFLPYVDKEELNRNLNLPDIHIIIFNGSFRKVLMPSKYYGILASGKPFFLITDEENDISRDIDQYGNGYSIRRGDSERVRQILLDLSANPDRVRDMGANSTRLYREKYARELVFRSYGQMLEELQAHV